jgi:hypothetical protein
MPDIPDLKKPIGKLAHGGLIGSAHPASLRDLYEAEVREQRLGKLAHGGLIGSAHPSAIDDVSNPEGKVNG